MVQERSLHALFCGCTASKSPKHQNLKNNTYVQVLLVEPCDMVRQVLMLALRAWGISVCAVKTEEEAISHLNLRSASVPSLTSQWEAFLSLTPSNCWLCPSVEGTP